MKKLMMLTTVVSFLFTGLAGVASAATLDYNLFGNLISLKQYSSTGVAKTATLDQVQPFTTGTAIITTSGAGNPAFLSVSLAPSYHDSYIPPFATDTMTYAGFKQNLLLNGTLLSGGTQVTATAVGVNSAWGIGSWCTSSSIGTCSLLYSENQNLPGASATLNFLFTSTALNQLNGTIVVNSKLSDGGWLERTYSLSGIAVPVPMSGMLFGSAVLALAGARRRRTA